MPNLETYLPPNCFDIQSVFVRISHIFSCLIHFGQFNGSVVPEGWLLPSDSVRVVSTVPSGFLTYMKSACHESILTSPSSLFFRTWMIYCCISKDCTVEQNLGDWQSSQWLWPSCHWPSCKNPANNLEWRQEKYSHYNMNHTTRYTLQQKLPQSSSLTMLHLQTKKLIIHWISSPNKSLKVAEASD